MSRTEGEGVGVDGPSVDAGAAQTESETCARGGRDAEPLLPFRLPGRLGFLEALCVVIIVPSVSAWSAFARKELVRREGLAVGPIRSMAPTTRSAASAILTSAHNAIMRSDYAALRAALSRLTAATALQEQFPSTEKGDTLLTSACRRGDARAVALVLAQGAGIIRIEDAPNAIGANAMHIACNLGHADVTELLLAYRADVNLSLIHI